MTQLFLKILNMSITASWIVLAVIVLRLLLKNAPKWISCLMWSIVALRLVVPFSPESTLSLLPSGEVIPQDIAVSQTPTIHSGIPAVNRAVNPFFTQQLMQGENVLARFFYYASVVWLLGISVMLLYSAVSYFRLRRQVRASLVYGKNVYICDDVASPFILGSFRPRIYIPSGMDEDKLQYVLAHENAHIARHDHWWKPLGFVLLTVYWFNPLLWLAYILLCRDIEQACDEKVIAGMDNAGKMGYSQALVACSVHRRTIMACPVAFGEVSVKARIKGVLNYRKPAFWIILVSVAACAAAAVCFLTDPIPCVHEYTGKITVSATCTQKGVETRTCALCEHSYSVAVDPIAHSYDEGTVTQQPTCIQQGSKQYTCIGCGAEKTEKLELTAHTAGEPSFITEPNCTEKGERSATCTVCQAVYVTEILETNGVHDMVETVLVAATCTAPGEGENTCTRCGYSEKCTYEQLAHTYKDGMTFLATCKNEGSQEKICTGCGTKKWIPLPRTTEHQWHRWSPYFYEECLVCGMRKPDSEPEISHSVSFDTSSSSEEDMFPVVRIWP